MTNVTSTCEPALEVRAKLGHARVLAANAVVDEEEVGVVGVERHRLQRHDLVAGSVALLPVLHRVGRVHQAVVALDVAPWRDTDAA